MTGERKRSLGFWHCWALVVGGAIGSAIFMMPAVLVPYGGLGLLSLVAASVGALFVAMMFSNLARRVTSAGGPYAYAHAGFGSFGGFLIAWGYWITLWSGCAAICIAFTGYVGAMVPAIGASPVLTVGVGLAMIWSLVGINVAGVRESGTFTLLTTILKLIPLAIVGGIGLLFIDTEILPPMNPGTGNPVFVFASAFALNFWLFVGIEVGTVPAEDVRNPERTIPRAVIAGTLTVAGVNILVALAVMGMLPAAQLAESGSPLADAGMRMAGKWGSWLISLGALVSMIGAFNVTMLAAGQVPMAAARDKVFPKIFDRLTKQDTPGISFVIAGLLVSALLVMNQSKGLVGAYTFVLLIATLTSVIPYAFCAMAGLVLDVHDKETSKARKAREAIISVVAFLVCMWVIATSGEETVYWTFILLMAGIPVYVMVTRNNSLQTGPAARDEPTERPVP